MNILTCLKIVKVSIIQRISKFVYLAMENKKTYVR